MSSPHRKTVSFRIDPELDKAVEHLKVDTGIKKESLIELGIRIVLALAHEKTVPRDLENILEHRDPEALTLLRQVVGKAGGSA